MEVWKQVRESRGHIQADAKVKDENKQDKRPVIESKLVEHIEEMSRNANWIGKKIYGNQR